MELDVHARVEAVVQAQIKPRLAFHGGDIRIISVENGFVRFMLLGQCSGCPAAALTTEDLIRAELVKAVPEIQNVVLENSISESLLEEAKAFLRK